MRVDKGAMAYETGEIDMATCDWFLMCKNESAGVVEHPTLGDVEICQEHIDWLLTDYSPTKMVPPMAVAANRARAAK